MTQKNMLKTLSLMSVLIVLALLVGCAKPPVQEMEAAKAAVQAVNQEGGQRYLPEETKKLNDQLNAALEEVKVQESKFFKSFTKATEMLNTVKSQSETTKAAVVAKREQLKSQATADITAAKAALEETKALLAKAPSGKGTTEDIEAMKADAAAVTDAISQADAKFNEGDYQGASAQATSVTQRAKEISTQISAAIEKLGKKKGGKKAAAAKAPAKAAAAPAKAPVKK